jgi:prepilin-type N-terminal cleavage/methylation domain-containing protein
MNTKNLRRPCGFTLVELLVVIAIIGVLAAILIPTLYRVVIKARQTKIAQELNQLYMAVESYRQKFGDFPPDFSDTTLVAPHVRKAFPNHTETTAVLNALTAANLTRAEAFVFWLAEFREDARQPLSGPDDKNHVIFPFEKKRLKPTRSITLGNRTVALYEYIPPDGKDAPYVYFHHRTYAEPTAIYSTANGSSVTPYKTEPTASDLAKTPPSVPYANETTFQIISAGLDGEYGTIVAQRHKVFGKTGKADANGNGLADAFEVDLVDYDIADLDNIANFSEGKIFEDFLE